jgi:hypothetical protein
LEFPGFLLESLEKILKILLILSEKDENKIESIPLKPISHSATTNASGKPCCIK